MQYEQADAVRMNMIVMWFMDPAIDRLPVSNSVTDRHEQIHDQNDQRTVDNQSHDRCG